MTHLVLYNLVRKTVVPSGSCMILSRIFTWGGAAKMVALSKWWRFLNGGAVYMVVQSIWWCCLYGGAV